jgi:c-di-GMP-binding flagellar brake protein YcgR
MSTNFEERRQHIRVYFESLEEIGCEFSYGAGTPRVSSAAVLDMSLGGLHLVVDKPCDFAAGERITLNRLSHRDDLISEEAITAEIRWVYTSDEFSRVYLGCKFLDLPPKSQTGIANLISDKLLQASSARMGKTHR